MPFFSRKQFTASLPTTSVHFTPGVRLASTHSPSPLLLILLLLPLFTPERNCVEQRVFRQSVGRVEGETSRGRVHAGNADASAGGGRAREAANGSLEAAQLRTRLGHEDGSQGRFCFIIIRFRTIDNNNLVDYRNEGCRRGCRDLQNRVSDGTERQTIYKLIGAEPRRCRCQWNPSSVPKRNQSDQQNGDASHDSSIIAAAQTKKEERFHYGGIDSDDHRFHDRFRVKNR